MRPSESLIITHLHKCVIKKWGGAPRILEFY